MNLRPANQLDLVDIAKLETAVFGQSAYEYQTILAFFTRFADLAFVAYDGDNLAGYIIGGGRGNPAHDIEDVGWVNSLAVAKDYRGQKVSSQLLDTLLDAFIVRGLKRAMLYVMPHNDKALMLYRSRGFAEAPDPHPSDAGHVAMAALLPCK